MTTSDYPTRSSVLLDTVHEHDHEHDHDMHHEMDLNNYIQPMNEANATVGIDQINLDRSISPNKPNSDGSSKRNRFQAVFLSRSNANDKKTATISANSVVVLSHPTNNTSGPSGGTNGKNDICEHSNVVATLSQHASAVMPVATLALPPPKAPTTTTNSASTTAKQFLIGRVRSRSKSDPQSVPDKSLFSRFFPKKTKKPLAALLTASTKGIDTRTNMDSYKKQQNINNNLLTANYQRSNNYEDDDYELDDRTTSTGSLSDNDRLNNKDDRITSARSSNTIRGGSRTSSGSGKNISAGPNALSLPTSDSQYYASMSSAPTGFSISYHKRMTKGNDNLRIQAALGRLQQQNKQGTTGEGTSQLMALFQDPKRSGAQSPNHISGSTRISKTLSGQTIITKSSSSDQPSVYCIRPTSCSPTQDVDDTFISDDEIYTHFMKTHSCYDIMPKSSKLVVFDTQLAVKKAFYALVHNGVRAAPIWDSKRQRFTAMLTITDFILILQKYYKEPNAKIEELEEHRIETWREVLREYEKPLLSIKPTDSLFEAVRILIENHVHRLPIVDPISHNVIFILTHKRILRFFYLYIYDWPQPSYVSKTLEELNLGTYHDMHIIDENTTVIEALNQFVKYRISALPVVDSQRKLVNIYSKFDVIGLAADKTYTNLNMTIKEALSFRKERLETVAKCYKNETLAACMERIIKAEVHRLVVVDNDEHVIGVLSLSDLLYYIVIRPTKTEPSVSLTPPPPPPSLTIATTTHLVPTINVFSNDDPVVEEDEEE
ncbi:unnamed protein product [Rotaria magnacalcarata]|uniref:CBS domain-containing protein n=1 Tax=Rotaria magnacalcarata TaxID=392030 RepID=A0A815QNP9_9BILA|nr:unnamed protein product [Rotaria magnacalcarata]CAF1649607.1 unnamed protein product [Rotaria magnacalcarata]CAF2230623.1 unnamed protein product [Rotaria magnacalcarata]CAF3833910.1 unnamed protein product [Rotaria magnacalcarata]